MPADWSPESSEPAGKVERIDAWPPADPKFYGSSGDFRAWLRKHRPALVVPEGEITLIEARERGEAWALADEELTPDRQGRATCPECRKPIDATPGGRRPAPCVIRVGPAGSFLPPRRECPKCLGRIDEGSLRYCPRCQASGFDRLLARQLAVVGFPGPEPPPDPELDPEFAGPERTPEGAIPLPAGSRPSQPSTNTPTRRQRREAQFSKGGPP